MCGYIYVPIKQCLKKQGFYFSDGCWYSFLAAAHKRQHYADRCGAIRKLFAVCAFEVSEGIYLSEMKSVLKRIHRGISERSAISNAAAQTSAFSSRSKVQCLFHDITPIDCCHSWWLILLRHQT
jgi:hypothetical protein